MPTNKPLTPWNKFGIALFVGIVIYSIFISVLTRGADAYPYWTFPLMISVTHFSGIDVIVERLLMKRSLESMHEDTKVASIPCSLGAGIATLGAGIGIEESIIMAVLIAVGVTVVAMAGCLVRYKKIQRMLKADVR